MKRFISLLLAVLIYATGIIPAYGQVTSVNGENGPAITVQGTTAQVTVTTGAGTDTITLSLPNPVGIGTTTPASGYVLHAYDNVDANRVLTIENPNTGTSANAVLRAQSDTAINQFIAHGSGRTLTRWGVTLGGWSELLSIADGLALGTYSADDLILGTNQLARVHVKSDGKVGIGTASPGQLLSVAGTVESTSGGFKFPDGTTQTTALSATTVTGTGTSGRCTYWTGSQTVDDDAGCLYDSSTDKLGILGQIVVGPQSPTYGIGVKGLINVDQTRAASGSISTFVPTLRVKAALSGERANSVFSGDVSGTLIEVDNTSYGLPFSDPYGSLASVMFHQLKPGFEGDSGAWVVGSDEDYYTGNITNGVNTITGMSPTTTLLAVGMPVVGQGIPAGTTISSVNSSTQITMSANATATVTGAVLSIGIGAGYNTGTISATTYSSNPNRSPGGIKSSIVYRSKLPLQVASGTSWKGGDDDYAGGGWGAAFWTENASAVANPNIHGVFLANYASWPDTGFVTNQLGAAVLVDVFTGADNNAWTDAFRVTPAGPGGGTSGAYMRIIADGSVMINTPSSFTGTSVEVKHNSATLFAITYDAHFYAALPTTSSSVYYVCIDNSTSELFRKATACN